MARSNGHGRSTRGGVGGRGLDRRTFLKGALGGLAVSELHVPGEANPLAIRLRVAREKRSGLEQLEALTVKGRPGVTKLREGGGLRDAPIHSDRYDLQSRLRSTAIRETRDGYSTKRSRSRRSPRSGP